MNNIKHEAWPALPYEEFKSTSHLLHMASQMAGKLKLHTPFEPHWANVALWITSRGLTTGLIPYQTGAFSIEFDLINHRLIGNTTWGLHEEFALESMSVAEFAEKFFGLLRKLQIEMQINLMPQEIPNPISFDKDTTQQHYNKNLANAWWRILTSSYLVIQRYHARFDGETPPIGLMWGTFDLRDARYNGLPVETTGINAGYIRRNAMDEAQIEIGWWSGNDAYPRAAYYSFTYPQPDNIENAKIQPSAARWDKNLSEFILDYDDLLKSNDPAKELLSFCESTYHAGATLAGWDKSLETTGEPV